MCEPSIVDRLEKVGGAGATIWKNKSAPNVMGCRSAGRIITQMSWSRKISRPAVGQVSSECRAPIAVLDWG